MKNYKSNYDYIKGCSKEEIAEMMTTLTVQITESLTGMNMTSEGVDKSFNTAMMWLDQPLVEGDYLN